MSDIDYQGGMKGIACYDLISFSWQSRANFDDNTKEQLKSLYFEGMMQSGSINKNELEKSYQMSLILRLFQLLGAYGFRGLVQQKPQFISSINATLENLQTIYRKGYLKDYPELEKITEKYLQPEKINYEQFNR